MWWCFISYTFWMLHDTLILVIVFDLLFAFSLHVLVDLVKERFFWIIKPQKWKKSPSENVTHMNNCCSRCLIKINEVTRECGVCLYYWQLLATHSYTKQYKFCIAPALMKKDWWMYQSCAWFCTDCVFICVWLSLLYRVVGHQTLLQYKVEEVCCRFAVKEHWI